jgi:hypothetical protein
MPACYLSSGLLNIRYCRASKPFSSRVVSVSGERVTGVSTLPVLRRTLTRGAINAVPGKHVSHGDGRICQAVETKARRCEHGVILPSNLNESSARRGYLVTEVNTIVEQTVNTQTVVGSFTHSPVRYQEG